MYIIHGLIRKDLLMKKCIKNKVVKGMVLSFAVALTVGTMTGCELGSDSNDVKTNVVVDTGDVKTDTKVDTDVKVDTEVKVDTDVKVDTGMDDSKDEKSESGVTVNGSAIDNPVVSEASDDKDTAGDMKLYEKKYVKSTYGCFIDDQAELLEPEEKKVLLTYLNGIYPQHFGPSAVVTVEDNNYESTKDFAREYFNDNFETEDGVIFIIDMQYRTLFIYSRGEFATYITDSKAEEIISQVASDATDKKYFKCAKSTASLIAKAVGIELMEDESFNGMSF